MPDEVREHLTRDQRPFLHPESLQILRFTASSLQFTHSSSTGFRSENTWHEIRDHSFIQNHSRSSDSQLLLFSSLIFYRVQVREHLPRDQRPFLHSESLQILQIHSFSSSVHLTHLLQGSGQRTPDTRSETIPSSRITPDLQIHSFFSSVHSSSTGFRSENTWHEIRDHSFIQNHSRSSDSHLLLFSSPHSSSTGFRSENTWHEIRDHSFIQNHSRSSDSQLLLFSSPHSSSTGFRSENTWPEIRDHSFIQNHSRSSDSQLLLFSSPHSSSTGFRSENTWHEIRDHSFIQNHSRSSDSQLLLFSSPHSSSTGFRSENTWHEIRDHSFIQNHSRSSDSQLLLFSSLTHLLQGSGQRTPDTRSETIPSSRITPDLQIHSFSSSVHLTHLLQGSDQRTPDTRSETIPSSRITPDPQIHSFIFSVHLTHLLQGSGQRTPDTRSETIPSSRITPDPSDSHLLLFSSLTHLLQGSDQRPFLHPESLQIFRFTASSLQFTSLIFYRVQVREHLTRDQRPFLHPESLQIFRFTSSSLQFTHSSSTGFRSENTWHKIRDHSFIQNHSRSSDSQLHLFSSPHSSSTGFRSENTWHEIRDHSFIQNQSRSSDSQLLLFSSLTHLLQGSGQRTPDTRSETIPSSRISPDLQIHSFFSSVHLTHLLQGSDQRPFLHPESLQIFRFTASSLQFTSLIIYRVQIREHLTRDQRPFLHPESLQIFRFTSSSLQFTSLIFYRVQIRDHSFIQNLSRSSDSQLLLFSSPHSSSTGFRSEDWNGQWPIFELFFRFVFGLLYGWKIQTWPIIRFLTESVTCWFFYLLVFDIIHDAICLNKMSRTSRRNIGHNIKNTAVYLIIHMGYFLSLCSPNTWVFAGKKLIFLFHLIIEARPMWSSSCVWICWSLFLDDFSRNPPKQHVVM